MVIWIGKSNKQKPQSDRTIWLGLFYWEVNNHFSSLHDNAKTPTELTAASSLMPIQSTSKLHYRCLRNAQRRKLGHSFISAITFRWFVVRVCDGFARVESTLHISMGTPMRFRHANSLFLTYRTAHGLCDIGAILQTTHNPLWTRSRKHIETQYIPRLHFFLRSSLL